MVPRPALLALLALCGHATADTLRPELTAEVSGENVVLQIFGTSDLPRALSDWEPVVHVEFTFTPLVPWSPDAAPLGELRRPAVATRSGAEVSLGFRRARIVTDAVEGNPALLEATRFTVVGQFSGLYRARFVLDPSRQNVRLRARGIAAAKFVVQVTFGDPAQFPAQVREVQAAIEDDAATTRRLGREISAMWERYRGNPQLDAGWRRDVADWRARLEVLPPRNDARPAHAIAMFLPGSKGALREGQAALGSLADLCDREMTRPPAERKPSTVAESFRRVRFALLELGNAGGRHGSGIDPEAALGALETLRQGPLRLKIWYEAWATHQAGYTEAAWEKWRAAFEEEMTEALFVAGSAAPVSRSLDLEGVARALVTSAPARPDRLPSLLAMVTSRILGETSSDPDPSWVAGLEREISERLERVETSLGTKTE